VGESAVLVISAFRRGVLASVRNESATSQQHGMGVTMATTADLLRNKPLTVYRDHDADLKHLHDRPVVVIGYGNQGRAQALNLRDSGVRVLVACIRDSSADQAEADGFRVIPIEGCAQQADVLMLLIPDEVQRRVYESSLAGDLRSGHTLCFAHGYNFHFGLIAPPKDVDVVLVAPRMIGRVVRTAFERGAGVPAYVAVGQNGSGHAKQTMLALAKGVGCTRAGVVEMTFEDETLLDLFVEQTLMPIFSRSMLWAFDLLVKAGFDPGVVTLELYGSGETAEVFQACAEVGFYKQLLFHSRTAQYGELSRTDTILPPSVRQAMAGALEDIQSGKFAREWAEEENKGLPLFNALLEKATNHPINVAEREIAALVDFGASFKANGNVAGSK
jgi:ketol-acid reductoisomerase